MEINRFYLEKILSDKCKLNKILYFEVIGYRISDEKLFMKFRIKMNQKMDKTIGNFINRKESSTKILILWTKNQSNIFIMRNGIG
jgi:hypothetical protein